MMKRPSFLFKIEQTSIPSFTWGDAVVLLGVIGAIWYGVRLAFLAPAIIEGPQISLSPMALPWYAGYSISRMAAAYVLSIIFTILYGYSMVHNKYARKLLLPLLDILQSIPILSFLPVVVLSLSSILPTKFAAEVASIVLIFTSQAWNLTFAWYQALTTLPGELAEASSIYNFNGWLRFRMLHLPFAAIALLWNSIMSWAGGWFFLMAAEIFTVGQRDFRLPGLGAYLHKAASAGDLNAIFWGLAVLIFVIVAMDQFIWSPLLAWSERFKLEMVESENPRTSWFYDAWRASRLVAWMYETWWGPLGRKFDYLMMKMFPAKQSISHRKEAKPWLFIVFCIFASVPLAYGLYNCVQMLLDVTTTHWVGIGIGIGATFLRVFSALAIALAWTLPLGVAIGTNPRLARLLQPVVQIAASIPATALFPVILLFMIDLPGGLSLIAVFLMLLGTQWYLLFNIIAGASAIPQDLKFTATLLQLGTWRKWRVLILPALFPYIITGAIAAGGGAWNASIVAEYVDFAGKTMFTVGIGSMIARATASGDYPLLLASTLVMITTVVLINRLIWRRLYRVARERFRMD
ncbi:MAG: ABC transporter permease subunit [Syntrophobacteraceae bacterium]